MSVDLLQSGIADAVMRARQSVGVARLPNYACFELTGPDVSRFLQNRLSNDVLAIATGQGQLNAALDRQGKIEGVFSLHRTTDGFFLLAEAAEAKSAIAAIEKYHIMEQFQVVDVSSAKAVFTAQGRRAAELLATLFTGPADATILSDFGSSDLAELAWLDADCEDEISVRVVRRSLSGETGYLFLVASQEAERFWKVLQDAASKLDGASLETASLDVLRIEAGIPVYGRDYDNATLLPETGFERLAVSYSKGCYLGQETIARIKTYGMIPKALVGLLFEESATLPAANSAILHDGREVGVLKSGAYSPTLKRPIALASLGKDERIPGKTLTVEIAAQHYAVTVALLPFYESEATQKSGKVLLQEALKLFSDGFDEAAIKSLQKAITLEPSLIDAYEALGVILSRQDRYDEAIALMEKVLTLDPDHVLAHTNLSVYYMKLGDKEKAEEEKAKATMAAFSRKAKEAGLTFDMEAERRKKEQATREKIAMFLEALKFNPADPLGNFGLGSAYLELKQFADAVEPLQRTIQAQPKHSVAYLSLGKALEALERLNEAKDVYEQGVAIAAAKGDLMPLKEMQARLDNFPKA